MFHRVSLSRLILICGWAVLGAMAFQRSLAPLFDPDLFWHMASGRWMAEHRAFLTRDVFSFSLDGIPWHNSEWLFQWMVYAVEQSAGWTGLFVMKALWVWVALGMLGIILWRCLGVEKAWFLPLVWAGYEMMKPRLFERAELFSWLCWGLLWIWLLAVRRQPHRRLWVMWMVPLFAFWVNAHPGVVYGVGFLFLLTLGALWAKEPFPFVKRLGESTFLSLVSLVINPTGWKMGLFYLDTFHQFGRGIQLIAEWKPTTLSEAPLFWTAFVAVGAVSVWTLRQKTSLGRMWILPSVFFAAYASQHVRSTALMAWTGLPVLALAASEILRGLSEKARRWWLMLAIVFLLPTAYQPFFKNPWKIKKVAWSRLPAGAVEFMKAHSFSGRGYNDYGWGGYVQWKMGPALKTFMDGRYLFLPFLIEELTIRDRCLDVKSLTPWWQWFDQWRLEYALTGYMADFWEVWEKTGGQKETLYFDRMYPPATWALVYWDDSALVFCRRGGRYDSLISRAEYKIFKPYSFKPPTPEQRALYEEEKARHWRDVPASFMRARLEESK